jgi:DUF1009 family protein
MKQNLYKIIILKVIKKVEKDPEQFVSYVIRNITKTGKKIIKIRRLLKPKDIGINILKRQEL